MNTEVTYHDRTTIQLAPGYISCAGDTTLLAIDSITSEDDKMVYDGRIVTEKVLINSTTVI
ncbi:hypothetical protein FOXB_15666 [Fusarium oxysporum f. sp. conglutinans Fo5176]|uniref:Uncharacterized protein n=1 Tax=Fusarium oxysporum (strain Fo5176) TaxID=660025 RepID=F9GAI4_FUSOF|nr:hypothetical protein FOXB_15666 [Fusarium oxysporum f. sp. conglutinans Fo5176]